MLTIHAKIKTKNGTKESRKFRIKNNIPAIIYGKNNIPISIILNYNDVTNMQSKNEYSEKPLKILIGKNEILVKIQKVQHHPFQKKLIHIDFIRI
ncbi:MAG: 50S ribosomal subunit protein L25 [Candidatus Westeberhardia cardiocondylae]|nr:50S ribosomal subunit protein L25 [Candidatus Westeberhardia cardiocondylae]